MGGAGSRASSTAYLQEITSPFVAPTAVAVRIFQVGRTERGQLMRPCKMLTLQPSFWHSQARQDEIQPQDELHARNWEPQFYAILVVGLKGGATPMQL